ncbi:hypothetical protein D3C74_496800 [compost metagenome]
MVASSLSIEEGSVFEGTSKMGGSDKPDPAAMKETAAAVDPEQTPPAKNNAKSENDAVYKTW